MSRQGTFELSGALISQLAVDADVAIAIVGMDGRYLFVNETLALAHGRAIEDHRGLGPADFVSPELGRRVNETIAAVQSAGPVRDVRTDAHGRIWEVSYFPLNVDGDAAVGSIGRDVTDREYATSMLERRSSQSEALSRLTRRALEIVDLQGLLDDAVAVLARELGVELAEVSQLRAEHDELTVRADIGRRDGGFEELAISTGAASHLRAALATDEPVVLSEFQARLESADALLFAARGVREGIAVKVGGSSGAWGVLTVHTTEQRSFTDAEVQLVATVATILEAAIAREHAQSELNRIAKQRRRLIAEALSAGERERERIADELHDNVLQSLLFARQECASIQGASENPELGLVMASLDEAARSVRATVSHLHPVTLADANLFDAVAAIASEYHGRTGRRVALNVATGTDSRHDQLIVYAIRELLTNVAKHAPDAVAKAEIARHGDEIVTRVSDNGPGFDPTVIDAAVAEGHVGLASLIARVESSGGQIQVLSGSDHACTVVRIALPLP